MNKLLKQLALGCLILIMSLLLPAFSKALGYAYGFQDALVFVSLAYGVYVYQSLKARLLKHQHLKLQVLHLIFFSVLYSLVNIVYLYKRSYVGVSELYFRILWLLLELILGLRVRSLYEKPYEEVLSFENYLIHLGLCILVSGWLNVKAIILIVFGMTFIYWLIQNQNSMESLLPHTSYNTPMLQKMKLYNLKWLLATSSFFVLAYIFHGRVYDGFKLMGRSLVKGLAYVLSLLASEGEPLTLEPEQGGVMPALPMAKASGSHWLDYVTLGVVMGLVIWKREAIWEAFKKASKQLTNWVKQLVQRIKQNLWSIKPQEAVEIKDYKEVSEFFNKVGPQLKNEKQWKKQLKAFYKMEGSRQKYKRGYYLLIEGYRLKGIKLGAAVTPREASQKVSLSQIELKKKVKSGDRGIEEETKAYEAVCYEEKPMTPEALQQLENHLRQMKG